MHVDVTARRLTAQADGLGDMSRIGADFEASGIQVDDLGLKRPSLDDVFLHLTGHKAEEETDELDEMEEARRVAEVAARFTLDAMPGQQMGIDADLNVGLIDEHRAPAPRGRGGRGRTSTARWTAPASSSRATRSPAS